VSISSFPLIPPPPHRPQGRLLRFTDPGDAGDLHAGIRAGGAQDLQTDAAVHFPQPDGLILAGAGQQPFITGKAECFNGVGVTVPFAISG